MGAIVSYLAFKSTGRSDDPDPATGLTSREKYLVQNSWTQVMKNPTDNGVGLLRMWLEKYPQYLPLFPFKDVPYAEYSTNVLARAHANNVMYALTSYVDALNDGDLLNQLLIKSGRSHGPRKATADGFLHLKEAILELFSKIFGPEEVAAWQKTLDFAFGVILKSLPGEKAT